MPKPFGDFARSISYMSEKGAREVLTAALKSEKETMTAKELLKNNTPDSSPDSSASSLISVEMTPSTPQSKPPELSALQQLIRTNKALVRKVANEMDTEQSALLTKINEANEKMDAAIDPLKAEHKTLNAELATLKTKDTELTKARDDLKETHSHSSINEKEIAENDKKIKVLTAKISALNTSIARLEPQQKELKKLNSTNKNPAKNQIAENTAALNAARKTINEHTRRENLINKWKELNAKGANEIANYKRIKDEMEKDLVSLKAQKDIPNADPGVLDKRIKYREESIQLVDKSIKELETSAQKHTPEIIRASTVPIEKLENSYNNASKFFDKVVTKHPNKNDRDTKMHPIADMSALNQVCKANENDISSLTLNAFRENILNLNQAIDDFKKIAEKTFNTADSSKNTMEYKDAVKKVDDCCAVIGKQLNPDQSMLGINSDGKGARDIIALAFEKQGKRKELEGLTNKLAEIDKFNIPDPAGMRALQKIGRKIGNPHMAGLPDLSNIDVNRNKIQEIKTDFQIDMSLDSKKKSTFTVYDLDAHGKKTARTIEDSSGNPLNLTKLEMKIATEQYNAKHANDPNFKPIYQGNRWYKPFGSNNTTFCHSKAHRDGMIKEMIAVQDARNKLGNAATNTVQLGGAPDPKKIEELKAELASSENAKIAPALDAIIAAPGLLENAEIKAEIEKLQTAQTAAAATPAAATPAAPQPSAKTEDEKKKEGEDKKLETEVKEKLDKITELLFKKGDANGIPTGPVPGSNKPDEKTERRLGT
ncbi:MAG: hypothetical protein NTZ67_06670 [Gammaproteobacteria bacterium]|nr:hypothetical protein [Gammaproteobacteria bacterium]